MRSDPNRHSRHDRVEELVRKSQVVARARVRRRDHGTGCRCQRAWRLLVRARAEPSAPVRLRRAGARGHRARRARRRMAAGRGDRRESVTGAEPERVQGARRRPARGARPCPRRRRATRRGVSRRDHEGSALGRRRSQGRTVEDDRGHPDAVEHCELTGDEIGDGDHRRRGPDTGPFAPLVDPARERMASRPSGELVGVIEEGGARRAAELQAGVERPRSWACTTAGLSLRKIGSTAAQ
jgi:hypothetical protein